MPLPFTATAIAVDTKALLKIIPPGAPISHRRVEFMDSFGTAVMNTAKLMNGDSIPMRVALTYLHERRESCEDPTPTELARICAELLDDSEVVQDSCTVQAAFLVITAHVIGMLDKSEEEIVEGLNMIHDIIRTVGAGCRSCPGADKPVC